MIVCWKGLFSTAIEKGDSTAPVSDKPTIRPSDRRQSGKEPQGAGGLGAIYLALLVTRWGLATGKERK